MQKTWNNNVIKNENTDNFNELDKDMRRLTLVVSK